MKTTTPTEKTGGRRDHAGAVFLAGMALVLLVNAAPSFLARVFMLPADPVREELLLKREVPQKALTVLSSSRQKALKWRPMTEAMDDLALAAFALAETEKEGSSGEKKALEEAIQWQRRSLGRAPANAFGWVRLGHLIIWTQGNPSEAAAALARSIDSAPYEPSLSLARLGMAVALLDKLDADVRRSLPFMVSGAWEYDSDELVKAAAENRTLAQVVEKAFENDPETLTAFREKLSAALPEESGSQETKRNGAAQKNR